MKFKYPIVLKNYLIGSFIIIFLLIASQADAQSRFTLRPEGRPSLFADTTKTEIISPPKNPFATLQTTAIPKAYCYEDLAIFCKLEVQLEKTFKFPIKIRLGEVNYVEMLEGKPYTPDLMMNYER